MNTQSRAGAAQSEDMRALPLNWKWVLAQGILTLVLGTVAFFFATAATLATIYVFAGFMAAGGIIQITQSILDKDIRWSQRLVNALVGIIYIIASLLMFANPLAASVVLTVIIASLFVAIGITRLVAAFRTGVSGANRFWLILFGLVNIGFGLYVVYALPQVALWFLGLMVSIEMIMHGWLLGSGLNK